MILHDVCRFPGGLVGNYDNNCLNNENNVLETLTNTRDYERVVDLCGHVIGDFRSCSCNTLHDIKSEYYTVNM